MKIFQFNHEIPQRVINTALFQTFVSGISLPANSKIWTDATGENISSDNRFSEMRLQYWIWKNPIPGLNHLGFEHYRRVFLLLPTLGTTLHDTHPKLFELQRLSTNFNSQYIIVNSNTFNEYLTYRELLSADSILELKSFVANFDIITVRPEFGRVADRSPIQWDRLLDLASDTKFMKSTRNLTSVDPYLGYWLNSYIMRREYFDEYAEFTFQTIQNVIDIYPYI